MKTMRITLELLEDGEVIHSRSHDLRMSEGAPGRPAPIMGNGSGLQRSAVNEASGFWDEVVGLGFLDSYMRERHKFVFVPDKGDGE